MARYSRFKKLHKQIRRTEIGLAQIEYVSLNFIDWRVSIPFYKQTEKKHTKLYSFSLFWGENFVEWAVVRQLRLK